MQQFRETESTSDPILGLDGRTLNRVFRGAMVHSLERLWRECTAEDRRILRPLGRLMSSHAQEVFAQASRSVRIPAGLFGTHPVSATVLKYAGIDGFPGVARLLCIAICVRLETRDQPSARRLKVLLQNIRGALDDPASGLRVLLGDVNSIPDLIRVVDQHFYNPQQQVLHRGFERSWNLWLRDRLYQWLHEDIDAIRVGLQPKSLLPAVDGLQTNVASFDADESEAQVHIELGTSLPAPPGEQRPLRVLSARAWADRLVRRSDGDLATPPEQLVPAELVVASVRAAMSSAQACLERAAVQEAEPYIALLLALATGTREMDLPMVVWGTELNGRVAVVDPEIPRLYRRIFRPPEAVVPDAEVSDMLVEGVEVFPWPLPKAVHTLLKRLAHGKSLRPGEPVLPELGGYGRYRLSDVSRKVAPELNLAPGQVRLALAAHLAQQFGPEVTQAILGDTFSLSLGPCYYMSTAVDRVVCSVLDLHERWFHERASLVHTGQVFGSRLVLSDAAARLWPYELRRRRKTAELRAKALRGFHAWAAHRDHLTGALLAVTGARPGNWLGSVTLDDVVADHGLIVIRDKANDALREVRLACTGRRWLTGLRQYLDRLIEIQSGEIGAGPADLARSILAGQAPLFAVADESGRVRVAEAKSLVRLMPEGLRQLPNFLRHRLNQQLQARGVDPELRHAQLGWVVMPAHVFSECSHWSARAVARTITPVLDDIMLADGWYPATQRVAPWSWKGLPDHSVLAPWGELARVAEQLHEGNVRRARAQLHERWELVTSGILDRLATVFEEYFPTLRLDVAARRLFLRNESGAVEVNAEHHALLCDKVRQRDDNPDDATEALVTRVLLFRLIRAAVRVGIVIGPLPRRPFLSVTSEPSPFFKGLGLAARHAEQFRAALLAYAKRAGRKPSSAWAVWMIVAFSSVRRLDTAMAAVRAVSRCVVPVSRSDILRVPASLDGRSCPMVFGGMAALALARLMASSRSSARVDEVHLGVWVRQELSLPFDVEGPPELLAAGLVELLQAAGRLELSGPERLILLEDCPQAVVPVPRMLAYEDRWPVCNAPDAEEQPAVALYERVGQEQLANDRSRSDDRHIYQKLMLALTPERFRVERRGKSDGKRGWRQGLERELARLHAEVAETSNVGLLIGYARHRLRFGGRKRRKLAHNTLRNDISRFATDLLATAGTERFIEWAADVYQARYTTTLMMKPVSARRQAFDALRSFHDYLHHVHQAPELDESALRIIAGDRVSHVEPGIVTPAEQVQVYEALLSDLSAEQARDDVTPEAVRLLSLRVVTYLVLACSGIRPGSMYGLTLGDVTLLGPGRDFVRVRRDGEFGEAKSTSALGFIPLDGELWSAGREWLQIWLASEKRAVDMPECWNLPLFSKAPGSRYRFASAQLTRRIDTLLKWSTGQRKAHCYWLRKTRVTDRHQMLIEGLVSTGQSAPRVCDTHGVLRSCGHGTMATALTHYLADGRVGSANSLHESHEISRAHYIVVTSVPGSQLDMAWQRANTKAYGRLRVIFERWKMPHVPVPDACTTQPPPVHRQGVLVPAHLADFARALAVEGSRSQALLRCGLSDQQAQRFERAALELLKMRGVTPFPVRGLRHQHAVMAIPRRLAGLEKLYELLDQPVCDQLVELSESWASQPHLHRIFDEQVILELKKRSEIDAADWLLKTTFLNIELVDDKCGTKVLRAPTNAQPSRSHAAPLKWILSLIWIHRRCVRSSASS